MFNYQKLRDYLFAFTPHNPDLIHDEDLVAWVVANLKSGDFEDPRLWAEGTDMIADILGSWEFSPRWAKPEQSVRYSPLVEMRRQAITKELEYLFNPQGEEQCIIQ